MTQLRFGNADTDKDGGRIDVVDVNQPYAVIPEGASGLAQGADRLIVNSPPRCWRSLNHARKGGAPETHSRALLSREGTDLEATIMKGTVSLAIILAVAGTLPSTGAMARVCKNASASTFEFVSDGSSCPGGYTDLGAGFTPPPGLTEETSSDQSQYGSSPTPSDSTFVPSPT